MNLRFVEAFYWVVSLKSVSRAAEKLFITQSAMSSRIASLEDELGVLLLDRRDKQFRLTVAGMRFFNHAQKLLTLQRDIKAEMSSAGGQESASVSLRLGVIESVLHSWLIEWIQQMRRSNPDFELELIVETTPVLVDHVRRGAVDLVFCALPTAGEGLRSKALPPMDMTFVGHADVHRKRSYSAQELAGFDLLTFQRGSQPHTALIDVLRSAGVEAKRIHNISSISAMVQLVENGFGVATLPSATVKNLSKHSPLKALRCEVQMPPLPVHASYREDPSSPMAQDVVEAALSFIRVSTDHRKNR